MANEIIINENKYKPYCNGDIKEIWLGNNKIWSSGTRGLFLITFGDGSIYYTDNLEDVNTYKKITGLSNIIKAYECGEYYFISWYASNTYGFYYSSDCIEWNSETVTGIFQDITYKNGYYYIKTYVSGTGYVYYKTSDFINYSTVSSSEIDEYYKVGDKLAKIRTEKQSSGYTYIYVDTSEDNGLTWTQGTSAITNYRSSSGAYWSCGHSVDVFDDVLYVSKWRVDYASYSSGFKCDANTGLYAVDINKRIGIKIFSQDNYEVSTACFPSVSALPHLKAESTNSSNYGETYLSYVSMILPDPTNGGYKDPNKIIYFIKANNSSYKIIKCADKNAYYILYIGRNINKNKLQLTKTGLDYMTNPVFTDIFSTETLSDYYLNSLVYKPL